MKYRRLGVDKNKLGKRENKEDPRKFSLISIDAGIKFCKQVTVQTCDITVNEHFDNPLKKLSWHGAYCTAEIPNCTAYSMTATLPINMNYIEK